MRHVFQWTVLGMAILAAPVSTFAQSTLYHLHKEDSATFTYKQLKTAGPDANSFGFQSLNLKNVAAGTSYLIEEFETQNGVPGTSGIIPAGSIVTASVWMRKTANDGTLRPVAKLTLNTYFGPSICTAGGASAPALTTTITKYDITCEVPNAISMTTSDRFFLEMKVWVSVSPTSKNVYAEVKVEGTVNLEHDSTISIPNPGPPPSITALNPTSGPVNWPVTITGTSFGATQGSSLLKFNGTTAAATNWSNTSITAPVPSGATSGPVTVTIAGSTNTCPGGNCGFTVIPAPTLTSVNPTSAQVGASVTISGNNFLATQGPSTVTFNGVTATPSGWSNTSITADVPTGASSGNIVVTVSNQASNGLPFTVIVPGSIGGTVTKVSDGAPIQGALVKALLTGAVIGSATTAANGTYSIPNLDPNTYEVRITATAFSNELRQGIAVTSSTTTTLNVSMYLPGTIAGRVTQSDGTTPIVGAAVRVYAGPLQKGSASTNSTGDYTIGALHPGGYTVQAANVGYQTSEQGAVVTENASTSKNFSLANALAGPVRYGYDALDRLVQVTDASGQSAIYRYDPVGNLLAIERVGSTNVAISGFSPARGPIGQTVTISGSGFSATPVENTVTFNGSVGSVVSSSPTQVVATVPAGASTGAIAVTTPSGSATSGSPFTVIVGLGPPTITGFSPQLWAGTGSLTINGTNFETTVANDRVNVHLPFATPSTATATALTVPVPAIATSGRLTVATPAGTAVSTDDFFIPPPGYSAANVHSTGRMNVGTSLPMSFPTVGKFSLVVFDLAPGHRVSAAMTNVSTGSWVTELYYPAGGLARTDSFFASGGFLEPVSTLNGSTYTALVKPAGSTTGNLTLTLYDVPPDPTATIVPMPGGSAQILSMDTPGQNGLLTFAGTTGQRVSLSLSDGTMTGCTDVSIRRAALPPAETILTQWWCFGTTGFLDTVTLEANETYRIVVNPSGTYTGSLTFTLHNVPPDDTKTIVVGGPSQTLTMDTPGQNGLLTFSGAASQQVSLTLSNGTMTGCTDVSIRMPAPDETVLDSWWCFGTSGSLGPVTLPSAGTYRIVVNPSGAYTGSLTFTLQSP